MAEATTPNTGSGGSAAAAAADVPICVKRDRPWVLTATILASSMGFIDGALMPITLPSVGRDLEASFASLQWISNVYLLTLSALIVVGGGLGDQIGRRRVFSAGVWIFAIASIGCAAAVDATQLIAARAVQGVGAALMIPQSLAIIAASYPKAERGAAIGLWASASALTTTLGPVIGGVLVDTLGWRAAFWINLPLAAICLAITVWRMPETQTRATLGGGAWRTIDGWGAGLTILGLAAASWALIEAPERGAGLAVWSALAVAVAAFAILPSVERRATHPIAPPALFADRTFVAANVLTLTLYGALSAALFLLPFDLIGGRGYSAASVGAAMLPFGLTIGLLSQPAGKLGDRFGPRAPLTAGGLLFAVACVLLALAPPGASYWTAILPGVVLMGLAMTISVAPLTTAVMNAASDEMTGAASGVNNAVSRAAGLLAVAGVGALAAAGYRWAAAARADAPPTLHEALASGGGESEIIAAVQAGYLACGALGLVAALLARALPSHRSAVGDA